LLKSKIPIDLRQKRLDTKKIDPHVVKNNSFTDIVNLINNQLIKRYNEKIERKKFEVLVTRVSILVNEYDLVIPGVQQSRLVEQIVDAITGYGVLQPWIAKKGVTNIEIESPNEIFVMENLKWKKIPVSFESTKELQDYIYRIFNRLGGRFTQDNPLGKIEDEEWNLRIRAGGFDLRPDSPTLSIRILRKEILTPEEVRYSMSETVEKFLRFAAAAGFTVGFVGPFGSGKTAMMGQYLSWIPNFKHIGLIQSSNEIQKVHPFMRRGLTRELVGEQGKKFGEMELLDFAKQENYSVLALGEFLDMVAPF